MHNNIEKKKHKKTRLLIDLLIENKILYIFFFFPHFFCCIGLVCIERNSRNPSLFLEIKKSFSGNMIFFSVRNWNSIFSIYPPVGKGFKSWSIETFPAVVPPLLYSKAIFISQSGRERFHVSICILYKGALTFKVYVSVLGGKTFLFLFSYETKMALISFLK